MCNPSGDRCGHRCSGHYGLERILDGVVPIGGPPHASLAKACLLKSGVEAYWFADETRDFVDQSFGFYDGNGPCARKHPACVARWNGPSVAFRWPARDFEQVYATSVSSGVKGIGNRGVLN